MEQDLEGWEAAEGPNEAAKGPNAKGAVMCLESLNSCLPLLVMVWLMRVRFFMSERDTLVCSHLLRFHSQEIVRRGVRTENTRLHLHMQKTARSRNYRDTSTGPSARCALSLKL